MIEIKKPNGYWTKEKCQEEALKYDNTKNFKENSKTAYKTMCSNGWYEICSHMMDNDYKT